MTSPIFPDPHIGLIDAWARVRQELRRFEDLAATVQTVCEHRCAVQYNPTYASFKKADCQEYPIRVCVACGLKEHATRQLDPGSFDPGGPTAQAAILAVYREGFRVNHFGLPCIPRPNRLDGVPVPTDETGAL